MELDQQLITYLRQRYEAGNDLNTIQQVLERSGYSEQAITAALQAVTLVKPDPLPSASSYLTTMRQLFFSPEKFLADERPHPSSYTYAKTLILTIPLNLLLLLLVDFYTSTSSRTGIFMRLLLYLGALLGGYVMVTLAFLFLLLFIHLLVFLLGGRSGLRETYRSFLYAASPSAAVLWLPGVNLFTLLYSLLLFYEIIRVHHKMSIKHAFWVTTLSVLLISSFLGTVLYSLSQIIAL